MTTNTGRLLELAGCFFLGHRWETFTAEQCPEVYRVCERCDKIEHVCNDRARDTLPKGRDYRLGGNREWPGPGGVRPNSVGQSL